MSKTTKTTILLFLPITVLYLFFVVKCNYTLVNSGLVFIGDVYDDLDKIKLLYSIDSWPILLDRIFYNNPELYHGYVTLYLPALLSYIPYKLFGDVGLNFAFRMWGSLFLIASYWIYAISFFQKTYHRIFFLVIVLLMPYTNMFNIWPRCESYLFFFTAIFVLIQKHYRWNNIWSFFFLGLAFVSRISILPYLPLFFAFVIFQYISKGIWVIVKQASKVLFWIIIGYFIGQPHNLVYANLTHAISEKYKQMFYDTGVDQGYSFFTWLSRFIPEYLKYSTTFYLLIAVLLILLFTYLIKRRSNLFNIKSYAIDINEYEFYKTLYLALGVVGLICILLIMTTIKITNSAWYLQHHFLFLFVGIFSYCELLVLQNGRARLFTLIFCLFTLFQTAHRSEIFKGYYSQGRFSFSFMYSFIDDPVYREVIAERNIVKKTLDDFIKYSNIKLLVNINEPGYLISDSNGYKIKMSYGPPFINFQYGIPDVIIFDIDKYRPPNGLVSSNHGEYEVRQENYSTYMRYVSREDGGECLGHRCYKVRAITDKLHLYYLSDILKKKI